MRRFIYSIARNERALLLGAKGLSQNSHIAGFPSFVLRKAVPGDLIVSNFHSTTLCSAKAKKGGGKGGKEKLSDDDDEGGDAVEAKLPKLSDFDGTMEKKLGRLADEFNKLRSGQVNTEIFKNVMVDAHGTRAPVSEVGQVSLKGPTKLSIAVYDPSLVSAVSNAIRDSGMSLNPTTEGNCVLVNIPKPSKETRDAVLKAASRVAEKAKQDLRQVRKDALDASKKLKGAVSEDETRRFAKEVEALTEKKLEKIVKLLKDKEKDIMAV